MHPWVSCERHRTAYAGPSEGTLRRYVVCRVNRMLVFLGPSLILLSAMYSAYFFERLHIDARMKEHLLQSSLPTTAFTPQQCPHNATLSLLSATASKGLYLHYTTLRNISVSPPTTPQSSTQSQPQHSRQRYEHNPSTAPFPVTRGAHYSKSINPSLR